MRMFSQIRFKILFYLQDNSSLHPMIYKFLKPHNFYKEILSSYKGTFNEMFVSKNESEQFCYVYLNEKQMQEFEKHFGSDVEKLPPDADEYPGSMASMKNNRIENYIRVESPGIFR